MSRIAPFAIIACLVLPALPLRGERLTVFAAISLKDALGEIAKSYESTSGDDLEFSFGASGHLSAQITEGAPADVFISAAQKQVDELIAAKVADESSRVVVAWNRLVLIVPAEGAASPVGGFADLADTRVKKLSIGQPRTVPAGEYATQALTKLKLLDAVRDRLIYGANVRQVLDYVRRGEVDAGIVYASDAKATGEVKIIQVADESLHDPIIYPAVVIARSSRRAAAVRFMKHLQSEAAQQMLLARGFAPPSTTRPSAAR